MGTGIGSGTPLDYVGPPDRLEPTVRMGPRGLKGRPGLRGLKGPPVMRVSRVHKGRPIPQSRFERN